MTTIRDPLEGSSVLHLEGPLYGPVGAELRHRVRALLCRGENRILLDLAGVSDLDAAGLGELARMYTMAIAANGTLRIANTSGWSRELLSRVGLLDRLATGPASAFDDENGPRHADDERREHTNVMSATTAG